MPELPEVETMRRGLLPIVGSKIVRVEFPDIPYRPIVIEPNRESLQLEPLNSQILAIRRIGKRVLVDLDIGKSIVMQPKMAGIAMLDEAPSAEHTRVIFHLCGTGPCDRFLYWDRRGLGNVCLWSPEDIDRYLGPNKLGPDASIADARTFIDRFLGNRREVKVAMLDQSIISGIGNMYAAEILFAAKVDPKRKCNDLSKREWISIHKFTLSILNEAIEKEGSTLKDGSYRNAINGEGAFQSQHQVYDRQGQPCLRCRNGIVLRIVQAQRSTFYCPSCQK